MDYQRGLDIRLEEMDERQRAPGLCLQGQSQSSRPRRLPRLSCRLARAVDPNNGRFLHRLPECRRRTWAHQPISPIDLPLPDPPAVPDPPGIHLQTRPFRVRRIATLPGSWHGRGGTRTGHHSGFRNCGSQNCACCRSANPDDWLCTCPIYDERQGQPWVAEDLQTLASHYLHDVEGVPSDTEVVFVESTPAGSEDEGKDTTDKQLARARACGMIMSTVLGHLGSDVSDPGNVSVPKAGPESFSEPFSTTGRRLDGTATQGISTVSKPEWARSKQASTLPHGLPSPSTAPERSSPPS